MMLHNDGLSHRTEDEDDPKVEIVRMNHFHDKSRNPCNEGRYGKFFLNIHTRTRWDDLASRRRTKRLIHYSLLR